MEKQKQKYRNILLHKLTITVLDYESSNIRGNCHTIPKPSSVSRVKGQPDSEHFSILWDIVIHNGHSEGELTYTIIEWAQTVVGKGTIVTRSYRRMCV